MRAHSTFPTAINASSATHIARTFSKSLAIAGLLAEIVRRGE